MTESMIERYQGSEWERTAALLAALAQVGVPADVRDLLVNGSKREGIPPCTLLKALRIFEKP